MTAGDSPDVISDTTYPCCTRLAQSMDTLYTGPGVMPLTVPPSEALLTSDGPTRIFKGLCTRQQSQITDSHGNVLGQLHAMLLLYLGCQIPCIILKCLESSQHAQRIGKQDLPFALQRSSASRSRSRCPDDRGRRRTHTHILATSRSLRAYASKSYILGPTRPHGPQGTTPSTDVVGSQEGWLSGLPDQSWFDIGIAFRQGYSTKA